MSAGTESFCLVRCYVVIFLHHYFRFLYSKMNSSEDGAVVIAGCRVSRKTA